jgi:hypothetical protein
LTAVVRSLLKLYPEVQLDSGAIVDHLDEVVVAA